jgi:hypothetical protein
MNHKPALVVMQEVTDADELVLARKQREQFDRNSDWLQHNIADIYAKHRGQYICVAGQQVFAADNVKDAIEQATAAHPDDEGWFTRYIPKDKAARVYAV